MQFLQASGWRRSMTVHERVRLLLRNWSWAVALSVTGCGRVESPPPPVAALQRSHNALPIVEPLFEIEAIDIGERPSFVVSVQSDVEGSFASQRPSRQPVSPTDKRRDITAIKPVRLDEVVTRRVVTTPIDVGAPQTTAWGEVQAIEPLPHVGTAQLATAFEYPKTTVPERTTNKPRPPAPVLSAETLLAGNASEALRPHSTSEKDAQQLTTLPKLPPASAPRIHDAATLTTQAVVEYQKGIALASRGSLFAARSKFLRALDQFSQAADAQAGTRTCEPALHTALRALEELEDFVGRRGSTTVHSDLTLLVRAHQTKVVTLDEAPQITANEAIMRYLQFAKQRLADALPAGSQAAAPLYGLGRVYDALAERASMVAAQDKARVFYEATLLVDPSHSAAANDLGVLLARHGRWQEAQTLLAHSVALRPTAAAYHNLAVIQERLGQPQLAARSRQLASGGHPSAAALADPALMPWQHVRWLDTQTFAQTSELASDPRPTPIPEPITTTPRTASKPLSQTELRSGGRWQQ